MAQFNAATTTNQMHYHHPHGNVAGLTSGAGVGGGGGVNFVQSSPIAQLQQQPLPPPPTQFQHQKPSLSSSSLPQPPPPAIQQQSLVSPTFSSSSTAAAASLVSSTATSTSFLGTGGVGGSQAPTNITRPNHYYTQPLTAATVPSTSSSLQQPPQQPMQYPPPPVPPFSSSLNVQQQSTQSLQYGMPPKPQQYPAPPAPPSHSTTSLGVGSVQQQPQSLQYQQASLGTGLPPPPLPSSSSSVSGANYQASSFPKHHYAASTGASASQFRYPPSGLPPPQQQQSQPPPPPLSSQPHQQYQQQQYAQSPPSQHHQQHNHNQRMDQLTSQMSSMSVVNQGWNAAWQQPHDVVNLMTEKDIRTKYIHSERTKAEQQKQQQHPSKRDYSCDKDTIRCTLRKIPDTAALLQKSRLPLGLLLHPFKDDPNIPLIQDAPIVRCRTCRTYINPYVRLLDTKRWQCNLCQRVNEVPDDFIYDFHRQKHVDIMTRPELNYGSIEYVASVEYMVRPPPPATYLFVFECTASAVQLGYIRHFAEAVYESLELIPGDARTMLGFIGYDAKLHFFNLNEDRPVHYIMPDIDDIFIPHTDCVLVNLNQRRKQIEEFLLNVLPTFPFDGATNGAEDNVADLEAALGPALQVAFKVITPSGGRITVIQTSLPTAGPKNLGCALTNREDPNQRNVNSTSSTAALTPLLNPVTDFYKKLALECSENQVTIDLFSLAGSFADLATVATASKFSGGSVMYYGSGGGTISGSVATSGASNISPSSSLLVRFGQDIRHYLTRPIGFEAVMRIRCTRGISIHTFHGNCFVRSTDLIALPNVNPDSSYAIQMALIDDLRDFNTACLQAALLYTASNGERRIRVHTIAMPVVTIVADVISGADQEAIVALLAKMAVDRSMQSNIQDAREAMINANVDIISTCRLLNSGGGSGGGGSGQYSGLITNSTTKLLPLYTLALMKHTAFRLGISTRVDERVYAMLQMKSLPIQAQLLYIYPNLYPIHYPLDPNSPPTPLQLTFANIERNGVYLLDTYDHLFIYICKSVHPQFLADVFGVTQWSQIPDEGDQVVTGAGATTGYSNRNNHINPIASMNGYGATHLPSPPKQLQQQQPGATNIQNGGDQTQQQPGGNVGQQNVNKQDNDDEVDDDDDDDDDDDETTEDAEETSITDPNGGDYTATTTDCSSAESSPVKVPKSKKGITTTTNEKKTTKKRTKQSALVLRKRYCPTVTLPVLKNDTSKSIHQLIANLLRGRPFQPCFHILREDSRLRYSFLQYMYDDRSEAAFSYYEFLQHLQNNLDK